VWVGQGQGVVGSISECERVKVKVTMLVHCTRHDSK